MNKLSARALRVGSDEPDHWGVKGSMYYPGLVHQNSLSNLVGEYASTKTTDEIIRAVDGSN